MVLECRPHPGCKLGSWKNRYPITKKIIIEAVKLIIQYCEPIIFFLVSILILFWTVLGITFSCRIFVASVHFSRLLRTESFIAYCLDFFICMWCMGYVPITIDVPAEFVTMLDFCYILSNSLRYKMVF